MKFLEVPVGKAVSLKSKGNLPERVHVFDDQSIKAVNAALAARRPLLIRGEPGVGKSQLASAVAKELKRTFVQYVVDAHTESRDLLWHFDAVQRLADAQIGKGRKPAVESDKPDLDICNYLQPGPLWWALNWGDAKEQVGRGAGYTAPVQEEDCAPANGCVLLIDEIDKAEMDVPNGLLEALGEGQFTPIGGGGPVIADGIHPLVIITSNGERSLPNAFLRRCLILNLELFDPEQDRVEQLCVRGKAHFEDLDDEVLMKAAELVLIDRDVAEDAGLRPLPGQAEYLDLLRAVNTRAENDTQRQRELLEEVAQFVVKKYVS